MKRKYYFPVFFISALFGYGFIQLKDSMASFPPNGVDSYLFNLRKNQVTGELDLDAMARARQEVLLQQKKKGGNYTSQSSLVWKELGPDNIGSRTRTIWIDKKNSKQVFAGHVSGGLWSTLTKGALWNPWAGNAQLTNMGIATITQASNGDIYFGTGEGLYGFYGFGAGSFIGGGIWKSIDGGITFNQLSSTTPLPNYNTGPWVAVNKLATDPVNPNKIYAATNYGLRLSLNGGITWMHPIRNINGSANTSNSTDVEVASDGTVFAAVNGKCYRSPTGDSATFVNISTGGTLLPSTPTGRLEITISPNDPNFVYVTTTNGGNLYGVYQSVNKGASWTLIGSSQLSPFKYEADYCNSLAVDPFDKGHLILGGVELWSWRQTTATSYGIGTWKQIAQDTLTQSSSFIHSRVHEVTFDKNTQGLCYLGTDGGIFRSDDMDLNQPSFVNVNNNYRTTRCFSLAFEPDNSSPLGSGFVIGSEDNGSMYIDGQSKNGFSSYASDIGWYLSGSDCEVSQINPNVFYHGMQYGVWARSDDKGYGNYYALTNKIYNVLPAQIWQWGSYVSPLGLYENTNALNSPDSVVFTADSNLSANSVVQVASFTNDQAFNYKLPFALAKGQSIKVQDIIQSKLVIGFNGNYGVWLTKRPLYFIKPPVWYRIAGSAQAGRQVNGTVECFAWSADGDILYFGTSNGYLYRLKNMAAIVDSLTGDIGDDATANNKCIIQQSMIKSFGAGRYVTGISVDPGNADNVVVSLANYGNTDYVYYSTNAASVSPAFSSKQGSGSGKLPAMPVYSLIIEKSSPKRVILGTEYGVYKTEDITAPPSSIVWTQENANGMYSVPVFSIRQQKLDTSQKIVVGGITTKVTNSGRIYIGTHGRGVFSCDNYYTPPTGIQEKPALERNGLSIYPNPSGGNSRISFSIPEASEVLVKVYDLNGKLVHEEDAGRLGKGEHQLDLLITGPAGAYIINLEAGKTRCAAKLLIAE